MVAPAGKIYTSYKKELEESGKSEISTTDPDARLMATGNNSVDVGYFNGLNHGRTPNIRLVLDFKSNNAGGTTFGPA